MSGHQPPVGRGAVAESVPGSPGGVGACPSPPKTNATVCARVEASFHTGRQQPSATAASRGTGIRSSPQTRPPEPREALPAAAARLHPAPSRWQGRDATKPRDHQPQSHRLLKEPIVRNPTLWQIDMGDGSWAVSCRTCRLSYRGPKAGADLLFDTHQCEPVILLPEQAR